VGKIFLADGTNIFKADLGILPHVDIVMISFTLIYQAECFTAQKILVMGVFQRQN
jgi:hypothetical protein